MASNTQRKAPLCCVPECIRKVQTHRLCKTHGGGARCRFPDCTKLTQSRGVCVAHDGGRRCSVLDCQNFRQIRDLCKSHAKIHAATRRPSTADHLFNIGSTSSKFSIEFLRNPVESSPITHPETVSRTPEAGHSPTVLMC
ncbi:hypothetical protein JG687_00012092 [Phytophthora cactorum]|uniref:WRKY19-like zinc finger domain-containing protein n=1 Tax=Phytophthora cactorum TaxID=29920 RepID=A0A8T1U427_9STRA|nr:hypothetical protein JG687_00012092 [Phytophthora cactorum]